ncbi:hypothetical protein ACS0TY_007032 [Phlomoides rotata]
MAKNVMVGLDDELIRVMERLTGEQPNLQIVPIVGMERIDREIDKIIGSFGSEMDLETEDHQLGVKLYRILWGRRFLIVLDDKIRFFFPDNDNRSRVVITTRISNVATHLSSSSLEMNFLDEDKSWNLFCENAFLEEGYPPELEEIGKDIVRECRGLPLSIVLIGGLLRNSRKTQE